MLSDRICRCHPAIGVEMEPSYRSTNAYIDNDDRVVGRETCDAFRTALHSCFLFLLSRQKDRDLTQPIVDLESIDSH